MNRLPLVLVLVLGGCAPSVRSLVAHHHDREALCALEGADADDAVLIREGLERDLAPRVEVSRIDVGPEGHHAMQVRVVTNAMPIDELRIRAVPTGKGVVPWDLYSLTEVTHEKLPSSREVSGSSDVVATVATFVFFIATVGIVRLDPGSRSHTEYPSEEEYRRSAPQAYELSRLLASECATPKAQGIAARCAFVFAVRDDLQSPSVDVEIEMSAHPERRGTCQMKKSFRVAVDRPTAGFGPPP